MRKRILSVLLAGCLLLSAGCSARKNDSAAETTTEASSEVMSDTHYETMSIPEGGWTIEELAKTIRINGESIEVPFTIESLGEDYKINDEYTIRQEDSNDITMTLMHQGTNCMMVHMTNLKDNETDITHSKSIARFTTDEMAFGEASKILSINGITISSKKEEVVYALGEPYEVSGRSLIYKDKTDKFKIMAITMGDDVVTGITVYLEEK